MRIERSICPLTILVKRSCLQCVSREASVRLQCLSEAACLQCVSRERLAYNACRKDHAHSAYREEHLSAYNACRKEHAYNAYREEHLSAYCACRKENAYNAYREKHLTAHSLVERSMLTMRIERSICPLTIWMYATLLERRNSGFVWSDGLTRSRTECINLYQDDFLDFIPQRRGREGDYAPS